MALLEARDLSVVLSRGGQALPALWKLGFAVEEGKTLGVVGESGAGKSMIARTISQHLPKGFGVSEGELRFDGQDLVAMNSEARRRLFGRDIAFVPQEPLSALNPVLTIGQQMKEHLTRLGEGRTWRKRAVEIFNDVHLEDPAGLLDKYPHQLSGGMCQRVLIAMAFVSRPRLLIADEPTTALDVTIQARIVELIAEMQRLHGTAVIFITHDLRLAAQVCDDIMVLYAGRQAEMGSARQFLDAPRHPYSRCLQLAVPAMTGPRRGLLTLPDRMPGLKAIHEIEGCRFAGRCPLVTDECRSTEPPLDPVGPGHLAACFHSARTPQIAPPPVPDHAPETGEPILAAEGVGKAFVTQRRLFRPPRTFPAVRRAGFELGRGEFLGIVGESGSGKTTLGRMVVGLDHPTEGRLSLMGQDIGADTAEARTLRRENIQIVFQDPQSALNPRRRVASIVTQAMEAVSTGDEAARMERARQLMEEIGLSPETAMRYPSQLSGGQKQRVNIARALCTLPRILVADEIASGLDVSVQAQLLNLLLKLREDHGFSMLFISHDLSVVRYLCDRVLVMNRGEIVEAGPTERVFSDPQHDYTRTLLAAVPPDSAAQTTDRERAGVAG